MSTESQNAADASYIKSMEEKTGKKLQEWVEIVKKNGPAKHLELVNMLKEKYGIGHGYANFAVHTANQSHAGAAGSDTDWLEEQYKGKENLRPLFDDLIKKIEAFGKDIELSPKKTYMSLRRKKQFAIIQPSTKSRLDIGLNLKGINAAGKLEAGGSWNAMCTHRIKMEEGSTADKDIISWIKQAYEQAG